MARSLPRYTPRGNKPHQKLKPKKMGRTASRRTSRLAAADPYQDGKIRIFLDDERPCPPGWTLARNYAQFEQILNTCDPFELAAVSLDWYLGSGMMDGHAAADLLTRFLLAKPGIFGSLEIIHCHSSDIEEATKMARSITAAIRQHQDLNWVIVGIGLPERPHIII